MSKFLSDIIAPENLSVSPEQKEKERDTLRPQSRQQPATQPDETQRQEATEIPQEAPRIGSDEARQQQDASAPSRPQSPLDDTSAPFELISAIAEQESGSRHRNADGSIIESPRGAQGIMQIMPETGQEMAERMGIGPYNPEDEEQNMAIGTQYIEDRLRQFDGDYEFALMAYNWGQGNVEEWINEGKPIDKVPNETINYVRSILPSVGQRPRHTQVDGHVDVVDSQEFTPEEINQRNLYDEENDEALTLDDFKADEEEVQTLTIDDFREDDGNLGSTTQQSGEVLTLDDFVEEPDEATDDVSIWDMTGVVDGALVSGLKNSQLIVKYLGDYVTDLIDAQGEMRSSLLGDWARHIDAGGNIMKWVDEAIIQRAINEEEITEEQRQLAVEFNRAETSDMAWYAPRRAAFTVAEGLPSLVSLIGATIINPKLGLAAGGAFYGAQSYGEMQNYQEETEEEISDLQQFGIPMLVGGVAGVVQKFQVAHILNRGPMPRFLPEVMYNNFVRSAAIAPVVGGASEMAQEMTLIAGELGYKVPEEALVDAGGRMSEAFYAGAVLSGALSTSTEVFKLAAYEGPPDAQMIDRFQKIESDEHPDGLILQPLFEQNNPDKPMFGEEITVEQAKQYNIKLPKYREKTIRAQLRDALDNDIVSDAEIDTSIKMMRVAARIMNMNLEQYLEFTNLDFMKAKNITTASLYQLIPREASQFMSDDIINAYKRARGLDDTGIGSSKIHKLTGWVKEPNGNWYYDRQTSNLNYNDESLESIAKHQNVRVQLSDIINDAELNDIIGDAKVGTFVGPIHQRGYATQRNGEMIVMVNEKLLNDYLSGKDKKSFRRTFHHELQHIIDFRYKKDNGANPEIHRAVLDMTDTELSVLGIDDGSVNTSNLTKKKLKEYRTLLTKKNRTSSEQRRFSELRHEVRDFGILLEKLERNKELTQSEESTLRDVKMRSYRKTLGEIRARAAGEEATLNTQKQREKRRGAPYKQISKAEQAEPVAEVIKKGAILVTDDFSLVPRPDPRGDIIKGAVEFLEDGRSIIKLLPISDVFTVMHEFAHVYRKFSTQEMMETLNAEYGRDWNEQTEEQFAEDFVAWLRSGKTKNENLKEVFSDFNKFAFDLYADILFNAHKDDITIKKETRDFFDEMFDRYVEEADQSVQVKSRWWENILDSVDIEAKFARVGLVNTGIRIKNIFSVEGAHVEMGEILVRKTARRLGKDKDKMREVLLISESKQRTEQLLNDPDADPAMKQAVKELRAYFDSYKKEYMDKGGLDQGFAERLIDEIEKRIKEKAEKGDDEALAQLAEELERAKDLQFVHIPTRAWFRNMVNDKPKAAYRLLKILAQRKRKTVFIQDLINEGLIDKADVDFTKVIQSYSIRVGKDLALLEAVNAAIKEGGAKKLEGDVPDKGFVRAPKSAGILRPFQLNPVIAEWVFEATLAKQKKGRIRRWLSHSKMGAFFNPVFLPMYDVIQSYLTGAINILNPIQTGFNISRAIKDVVTKSDDYWEAELNGLSAQTASTTFEQHNQQFQKAEQGRPREFLSSLFKADDTNLGIRLAKDISVMPFRLVTNIYDITFDLAWYGDRAIRQITYRHFKDNIGLDSQNAAQEAALSHADYSSVPQKTRERLNMVFFTPTFKIAMGKFLVSSIRSLATVVKGIETKRHRQKAAVLANSVALMAAFDMMMTLMFDFERDEFGRRYEKRVDTELGPKDLVFTWSSPHNLFLKYYERTANAFRPEVLNTPLRILQSNSWEFHPLNRTIFAIINNEGTGRLPIYDPFDSPEEKALDVSKYFIGNIYAMFRSAMDQDLDPRGADKFADEFGTATTAIITLFAFPYIRDIAPVRKQRQIEMLNNALKNSTGANRIFIMMQEGYSEEDIQREINKMPARARRAIKGIDQLAKEIQEEHYGNYPRPSNDPGQARDYSNFDSEEALSIDDFE